MTINPHCSLTSDRGDGNYSKAARLQQQRGIIVRDLAKTQAEEIFTTTGSIASLRLLQIYSYESGKKRVRYVQYSAAQHFPDFSRSKETITAPFVL